MKTFTLLFSALLITILLACSPKKPETTNQEAEIILTETPTYSLTEVWASEPMLKTPESVIYDKAGDVIYVSNVNENPWEKDGNGFIAKVSPTGEILDAEWVSGMNGPKGMAIVGNTLYAADLDEVVAIDIEKGEIIEKIKIDGASGLNDITSGENGEIYISDSNEGKIFQYKDGTVSVFNADAPGRPNGLLINNGELLTAFSETSDFVSYDLASLAKTEIASGIGAGDGVTPTNEAGTFLVSDWNGEIFIVDTAGNKQSLLNTKEQSNTADIWFIPEQNLVLVPTFFDNRVVAYRLNK